MSRLCLSTILVWLLLMPAALRAASEWQIAEIFSNNDGSVQFIELFTTEDGQNDLTDETFFSTIDELVLDHDLASASTAGHSFLLGTADFAALAGAVTPDYIIPENFFSLTQDGLVFTAGSDVLIYEPGQLPLDGINALLGDLTTAANSPKNFAGQIGSVVAPTFFPWQNPDDELDVDDSGAIEPLDALIIINELNSAGSHVLPVPTGEPGPPPFYDVDPDNAVTPTDAIQVINFLNEQALGGIPAIISQFDAKWRGVVGTPGATAGSLSAAAVPEPSSAVLAALGAAALLVRRRRAALIRN